MQDERDLLVAKSMNMAADKLRQRRLLITTGVVLLLAACRGVPERDADASSWLLERQQYFHEHEQWSSRGRMAISDGNKGLSVNFDLLHQASGYELILRTTGGRWTLTVAAGTAVLEGTRIERMQGSSAEPLVQAALGWPVPVSLLVDWLRALPGQQQARMQLANDGSLKWIRHQDWSVEYSRYELVDAETGSQRQVLMPTRLEASDGAYRIRTLISSWAL
ncbi:MAG: lipoprotein insertase outer membrane protein LolB [Gammaproteobacteria bacterium]|jgi:outer membrane lipoprotein LolB|nr:lipoprotein insertase outer membrane protein LolB [Gammaproteobacteria bacterium]